MWVLMYRDRGLETKNLRMTMRENLVESMRGVVPTAYESQNPEVASHTNITRVGFRRRIREVGK